MGDYPRPEPQSLGLYSTCFNRPKATTRFYTDVTEPTSGPQLSMAVERIPREGLRNGLSLLRGFPVLGKLFDASYLAKVLRLTRFGSSTSAAGANKAEVLIIELLPVLPFSYLSVVPRRF